MLDTFYEIEIDIQDECQAFDLLLLANYSFAPFLKKTRLKRLLVS